MTKLQRIYRFLRTETSATKAEARVFAIWLAGMSVSQVEALRVRHARRLLDALRETAPNGRDYYTISSDAINVATTEHRDRLNKVNDVICALDAHIMYIDEQRNK